MTNASVFVAKDKFRLQNDGVRIADGQFPSLGQINKFGHNESVGTAPVPICSSGFYRTPITPITLEAISDNVNDTVAGTGARKIIIEGLAPDFTLTSAEIELNGTSASLPTTQQFIRMHRAYVSEVGVYATQNQGSHEGNITIRESGAGDTWGLINGITVFSKGQTQIGAYTVPAGYKAFLMAIDAHTESNKTASLYVFQRPNANVVAAPYSAMRLVYEFNGVAGSVEHLPVLPLVFDEYTDFGFLGRFTSGSGIISVDFEILLVSKT